MISYIYFIRCSIYIFFVSNNIYVHVFTVTDEEIWMSLEIE